jgi:excisionase family DNA binding protein
VTDRIVVLLPDGRALALEPDVYRTALAEGAKLCGVPARAQPERPESEPLLDSDQLAAVLAIPASWLEQKAREGAIPSLQFGRRRRFKRSEVEAAVLARRATSRR